MAKKPSRDPCHKPGEEKILTFLKCGHRYLFQYRAGDEIALFYTLMEYATDERFNLTVKDLVHCTSKILKGLASEAEIDLDKLCGGKANPPVGKQPPTGQQPPTCQLPPTGQPLLPWPPTTDK